MGFLSLFIVATNPVLKVLLVTALGSFLALDSIGILGDDARKHLNKVVFFVFNPALVSSNLAKTITYESMLTLWFMPINILFTVLIGSALGWILIQITRPPSHLRGLILGCCAAGNLGNLLIIIIPAICKETGSPFGDSDACSTYGLAYASLSMAIGALYLWSYVYNIVRISSSCTEAIDELTSNSSDEPLTVQNGSCEEPLLSKDLSILENQEDHFALSCSSSEARPQVPILVKFKQYLKTISGKINLKTLFAPSTTGAIVGFFVGVISPIRWLMIGDSAPLRVVEDSAYLIGEGAIPATTLIMGANLLRGLRGSDIRVSLIVGIIAVRYIALPLFGILIVKGALHFGLVQSDPLYTFVLLLQFAVPPAMNIGTITQLFGAGERECSVILLWTYGLASIALTLWSTFFMWLIVGFFVGVISPIRWLIIGDSAPLRVIEDSAYLIGLDEIVYVQPSNGWWLNDYTSWEILEFLNEGAIPAMTLIMGANLLRGLQRSDIHVSLIVGIVVVRFIALPLLGILIIKGVLHFGLVQADPLYTFVLLLQFALPPAMNIGTITQLFGSGERECSVILLWTYGLASIALTFGQPSLCGSWPDFGSSGL